MIYIHMVNVNLLFSYFGYGYNNQHNYLPGYRHLFSN